MITHLADARTRVPLFAARVAPLIDIRAIVDSELLPFPYRGSARWNGLSLSSIGFIAVQRKKKGKKSERFVDSSLKYSPSCGKKMTSNIRTRLEAVVLRHVGTLGYDLSRIHRYSKLFET